MGAGRTRAPQKKISGKYFWANVMKNLGILLIFHTYISGQKVLPPKVDSAPTPMQNSQNPLQTNNHHDAVITIKFITHSAHYS